MTVDPDDDWEQLYVFRNGRYMPVDRRWPGPKPKYPLHQLLLNESFFVPFHRTKAAPIKSLYDRAKRLDITIKQKVVSEKGQVGVRVWRLK